MAQTQLVRGVATSIHREGNDVIVRYHNTNVVRFDEAFVTLNSGGWETVTTKRRMNQASREFNLGYSVWQKRHVWYVTDGNGDTQPFKDGLRIPRRAQYWDATRGEWIAAGRDA